MLSEGCVVDPEVSRRKFAREITAYKDVWDLRVKQGWMMVRHEFPEVTVLFAAPQLKPSPVLFGVRVNFENYDLWPPSVVFVHPFSLQPMIRREQARLAPMVRQAREASAVFEMDGVQVRPPQELLVAHSDDDIPFLCLPGVREYHDHPAHTGDGWLARRGTGEGTLAFLLENIHRYAIAPIKQYQFGISVVGMTRELLQ